MSSGSLSEEDRCELIQLDEAMWRAETRFDPAFQALRFADDFVEFGRSGRVYDRAQIVPLRPHRSIAPCR